VRDECGRKVVNNSRVGEDAKVHRVVGIITRQKKGDKVRRKKKSDMT